MLESDVQKIMEVHAIMERQKRFKCAIDGKTLDVYEFSATESISEDFRVDVTVVSEWKPAIRDYLLKEALLTIEGKNSRVDRMFQGTIIAVEECLKQGRFYLFKITFSSCLWNLTQMHDIRIFQNLTTPEIIAEVLKTSRVLSFEYEFRFRQKYSKREYCVQYRETNLAFIKRLMSEEGMFFYCEIKDGRHFLVIGDSFNCHKKISGDPAVIYSEKGRLVNADEFVTEFFEADQVTMGRVQIADYHFAHPSTQPVVKAYSDTYDTFENYDYPGNLVDDSTRTRIAKMNLERETQKRRTLSGKSVCRHLTAGHKFFLLGKEDRNSKEEYLLSSVTHHGLQPQSLHELTGSEEGNSYSNTFTCVPTGTVYRPERISKPSVTGVQSAIVTGPESEEIYTDKYGRIKVQFHWDRLGKKDYGSSCWIRVAQPWAGAGFGAMFIPRIGQEVIIDFIDGDPDRPIVIGSVYNGRNLPPYSLPVEKTKSTIKTETTPGGKGFNEIRFEDKKGQEEIYIHGQKDWNIEILNDKTQTIGHDEKLDVKNDRTKTIGHDQKEEVKNDKFITVEKNHTETIGENMSVKVGKNLEETTSENKTVSVGKNLDETIKENAKINVTKNREIKIGENNKRDTGKNLSERINDDFAITVGENGNLSVGKDYSISVNEKITISSGKEIVFICGNARIVMKQDGKIQINGYDIHVTGNGNVVVKGRNIAGN